MAKNKRGQGEGSIRERFKVDKKTGKKVSIGWEARYTVGVDANGKQIRKSIYGKTSDDVKKALRKVLTDLDNGTYVEPTKMTLGSWLDTWFKEYVTNSVKPSTRVSYDLYINKHIKPNLGHLQLKDVRPEAIQKFYNEKLVSGRIDKCKNEKGELVTRPGGLNPKTIKNMHNMLHEALEQALKNNHIVRNPCKAVILPKIKKHEMRVLTPKEQQKLLEAARQDRLGMGIVLALATGLRLGELLALQWKDINTKAGTLSVQRTVNRLKTFDDDAKSKTAIVFGEPKTKSSRRTIPLQGVILKELKEYKKRQNREKVKNIAVYQKQGFVFANEIGNPIEPRTFQDIFYKLIKEAGIPGANFHCLRHTFATRALEAGIPAKTVSEILGHSNISTTLDLYSHVSLDLKKESMEKLADLFTVNPVEHQAKEDAAAEKQEAKVVNFPKKSR
jgi:integrase